MAPLSSKLQEEDTQYMYNHKSYEALFLDVISYTHLALYTQWNTLTTRFYVFMAEPFHEKKISLLFSFPRNWSPFWIQTKTMFGCTEWACEDWTACRTARFKGSGIITACHTVHPSACMNVLRDHLVLPLKLCKHITPTFNHRFKNAVRVCAISVGLCVCVWKWA